MFCRVQNATLPKIPSVAVQNFLYSFVFDEGSDIWLGLVCWGEENKQCVWWDYTHPTYTNWDGHPAAYPTIMWIDTGIWFNQFDYWPQATVVVCEKPARNV